MTARRKPAYKKEEEFSSYEKSGLQLKKTLKAKTVNQQTYINSMFDNTVTIGCGFPGSGKTFIACGIACEMLSEGTIKQIILSRPIVNCGDGVGWLKGTLEEKTNIYFTPMLDCIEFFLGVPQTKELLENKVIRLAPLEFMRGSSIKDSFLILDEASNASLKQLRMLLSRLDHGSVFAINGDYKQSDLDYCDFKDVVSKLENPFIKGIEIIKFESSDCQRSPLVKEMMERLE